MAKKDDPKGVFSFQHEPDALDQLALEDEIAELDRKIAEVETSPSLIPGRQKKQLAELGKEKAKREWKLVSIREKVAANTEQAAILENQRVLRKRAAEEANKHKAELAKEIGKASMGVAESEGQPEPERPEKPDRMADYDSLSNEQKQKLQADMLETEPVAENPEPADDDPEGEEWLLKRRLKRKKKIGM